jgi:hypothetical protein
MEQALGVSAVTDCPSVVEISYPLFNQSLIFSLTRTHKNLVKTSGKLLQLDGEAGLH